MANPPQPNRGGAPRGNQNRLVHGRYTRQMVEFRARVRAHIRECRALIAEMKVPRDRQKAARAVS